MAAPSSTKSLKKRAMHGFKIKKAVVKSTKKQHIYKPITSSTGRRHAVASEAVPLQIEDEGSDFPRGSGSIVNWPRHNEDGETKAREKATKSKRKFPRKSQEEEDDLGYLTSSVTRANFPKFANRITWKNVSSGMKLWGVVVEVNPEDLVISLPGGLCGFVRAEEASDVIPEKRGKDTENNFLQSIFYVGQLVSCTVLDIDDDKKQTKGSKRIWLSLRLALLHKSLTPDLIQEGMVLTSCVKSVEDHGYISHFGSSSFSGFLHRKHKGDMKELCIGQLVPGIVTGINMAHRVVYLESDPDMVAKCLTKDFRGLSISLLVPGMMVTGRVQATLENGILISFLTYFTGTVDIFHLQSPFPTATWKTDYSQNKMVAARILFIDPSTRAIGLTMNKHLLHHRAPPVFIGAGDIFENSKIVRIDKRSGLLLEIPTSSMPTCGYVRISDVADEEIKKLGKKFKVDTVVRARALGFRYLEGYAICTMKATALEDSVFTHSDVKPGMRIKARIISVDQKGAIVQFPSGIKALCPVSHMSEFEFSKVPAKFKVGVWLLFRVLGCKSKRITVTHKKTLVRSKLTVITSHSQATEGILTHGWIMKTGKYGCFVRFYNGVKGFVYRTELGLDPGIDPSSVYHVGQVVKCRVLNVSAASHRINLSLVTSSTSSSSVTFPKLGTLVSGTVEQLIPGSVVVNVNGCIKGVIYDEHLADHKGHARQLKSLLQPGHSFDKILVLDTEGSSLVLSAKYSLLHSHKELPSEILEVHPYSVVHGYICNISETGCFVRFLGRLTGFAPKNQVADTKISDIREAFYVGQSVRCYIIDVNVEEGRMKISLKQSCSFSNDASFVHGYFLLEEKIARLQLSDSCSSGPECQKQVSMGQLLDGEVQEIRETGSVVGLSNRNDFVGFITHYQLGGKTVEIGSVVRALVVDVSEKDGIMDLSLKSELISGSSMQTVGQSALKKRTREACEDLELYELVNALVEIVKEDYLVLSVPDRGHAIGYASIYDYNTQMHAHKHFFGGQSVLASVGALRSASTGGRLLMVLKSLAEGGETSRLRRIKKKLSYTVGSVVHAEIIDIKPLELRVRFGPGFHGRVHISEVADDGTERSLSRFKVGETLNAVIVARVQKSRKEKKYYLWELSVKPSILADINNVEQLLSVDFNFSVGDIAGGFVIKVVKEWLWLTVSRNVRANVFLLDSTSEPFELQKFQNRFRMGQFVSGCIISIDREKKILSLMLRQSNTVRSVGDHTQVFCPGSTDKGTCICHISQGDIIGGRISKILPGVGGLVVQVGRYLHGRVHYTEIMDTWVPEPLHIYQEGQFVKCKVLEINHTPKGTIHVELSMRTTVVDGDTIAKATNNEIYFLNKRYETTDELCPNMEVQGYVKNVMSKGCFVILSRKIDAKILLSNLADVFVKDTEKEFPIGKLIKAKVLSVDHLHNRVELTLRTNTKAKKSEKSQVGDLQDLHIGDVINGTVKRVESYGLFITIDHTNMVGLCHISEISDNHIEDIGDKYEVGERVIAKILKVDEERHRISLGMKNLYLEGNLAVGSDDKLHEPCIKKEAISHFQHNMLCNGSFGEVLSQYTANSYEVLAQVESRGSVPPLEVALDDLEGSGSEIVVSQDDGHVVDNNLDNGCRKRKKNEREVEIRAAEERRLEMNKPQNADEYEELVRSSPNSSYIWINYMNFMVSLTEIEKARLIAERALRTINFREEGEKLNIWIAYLNLENEYGNPPKEAVMKVFQRALQYCDPKKVHLALSGLYERTKQHDLMDEHLSKVVQKFRSSCKVWLKCVCSHLHQGKDDIQSIVNRALLSLPRRKHIKFLSHVGVLEFKDGLVDRGRAIFEGMLREYPKRTDLWSVYLDQEICQKDTEVIRALFERATCLCLPLKNMKFLFKKYLDYEKRFGDLEHIDYVKRKAMEYVES